MRGPLLLALLGATAPGACGGGEVVSRLDAGMDAASDGPLDSAPQSPEASHPSAETGTIPVGGLCPFGPLLIDDMTHLSLDGPGVHGAWYTYSDRTNPYSQPPILLPGPPPGVVRPPEGDPPSPANGLHLMLPSGLTTARECSGGGEDTWGAGFGFDLADAPADGGNAIPFWACDGGAPGQLGAGDPGDWSDAPDSGNSIPTPFDASAHLGISFWAVSLASTPAAVEVRLSERRTSPWGGVCNPCSTRQYLPDAQCGDDYLYVLGVSTSWTQFTLHWTQLATWNTTKQNLPPGGLDPSTLYSIAFHLHSTPGAPLPAFDVAVACIQFVDR